MVVQQKLLLTQIDLKYNKNKMYEFTLMLKDKSQNSSVMYAVQLLK